ncbi:hypothetical protein [Aeromicrobium sp. HA]|nr:hypothetical protein [Aeromicrobium sp. HA]
MIYPHCKHCCWGDEVHPDDAPGHDTPCWTGCEGATPAELDLFEEVA